MQVTDGTTTIDTVDGMCVPIESNFLVNFDYLMESSYITTSTSDSFCAGSIRLSPDNFSSSCVRMSSEPTTSNNIAYTLDPYDNLSYNTTYNLRVTTTAEDVLQNNLASDYDHSHSLKTSSYLAASDSEIFVTVGQYGITYRSGDNGASWDNETCSVITQLNGVTYGSNTFVGVGASGRIVRSTNNGSSWSAVSDVYWTGRNYNGVAYGNSTFVAVGYRKIIRSTNSGSSFSAPMVTGALALLSQAFPNHTPEMIVDRLLASANNSWFTPTGNTTFTTHGNSIKHGYHSIWGHGIPDAHAALSPITSSSVSYTHLTLPTNREV